MYNDDGFIDSAVFSAFEFSGDGNFYQEHSALHLEESE